MRSTLPSLSIEDDPMKLSESILAILRCPETHQPLVHATPEEINAINDAIDSSAITDALVREDRFVAYRIDDDYPILLLDEQLRRPDGRAW